MVARTSAIASWAFACSILLAGASLSSLKSLFPGLKTTTLDYSSNDGKELYDSLNLQYLPTILFDDSVKEGEGYSNIQGYLQPLEEYQTLKIGATFDPNAEICDNNIDDDNNDLMGKLKTLLINNNFNNNLSYSTENPSTFLIKKFGEAPSIYTIKANSWTISTASMLIYEKSPDFSYISLTDYPMHKFKPESTHSLEHLKLIDESICELINKNPDYQIFITADHGMSDKTKLVNIENELSKYNIHSAAIPIIKDKHEIHHSNLGGSIYLYLNDLSNLKESKKILKSVDGIEDVLNKSEACQKFNLNSNRIGDLMILGQKDVVFGNSDISLIPNDLRSHASTYETKIPLIGINTTKNPDYFIENRSIGNYIIDSI